MKIKIYFLMTKKSNVHFISFISSVYQQYKYINHQPAPITNLKV